MALHYSRRVTLSTKLHITRTLGRSFASSSTKDGFPTAQVTNERVQELISKPLHPLTLSDLVKHGRPPLSAPALLSSANFTLSVLPARLAQRIFALRNLPWIVVSNFNITKILNNYVRSLSILLPWAEKDIRTIDDEIAFTGFLADLVQSHANTIPVLARGFLEARKYISAKEVTAFLDEHLRARIGTRLVAEQHISLHMSSQPHQERYAGSGPGSGANHLPDSPGYIGVIDTEVNPAAVVGACENIVGDICEFKYGVRPSVVLNGDLDYTFAHIPVHMEYIVTELLKNAFRATIESRREREPVEVTIAPLPELPTAGPAAASALPSSASGIAGGVEDPDAPPQAAGAAAGPHPAPHQHADENASLAPESLALADGPSAPIAPMPTSTPGVTIRIRDRGGGISPANYARIWEYSFTTFSEEQINSALGGGEGGSGADGLNLVAAGAGGGSSLAGLGYGLPLGRAYAEYFGGSIAVQNLYGYGVDVYLRLKGIGRTDFGQF